MTSAVDAIAQLGVDNSSENMTDVAGPPSGGLHEARAFIRAFEA